MTRNTSWLVGRALVLFLSTSTLPPAAAWCQTTGPDFNGDGYGDLAAGIPNEDLWTLSGSGAVAVVYGSLAALVPAGNQFLYQSGMGLLETAEQVDRFGDALAWGDFNADGYSDLAVGVPGEALSTPSCGLVQVVYGSATGLGARRNQLLHQDLGDVHDGCHSHDYFGSALAAGDFNGDGYGDLAVGVPGEPVKGFVGSGAFHVFYGSAIGLRSNGSRYFNQYGADTLDEPETGDELGGVLAAGDFNGDGIDDLAVSATKEDVGAIFNAGVVHVLYGAPTGLDAAGNQLWHQDTSGVLDIAEEADGFGWALAVGDFNGDFYADLAVGVPYENLTSAFAAGVAHVLYGSESGLTVTGNQLWHQNVTGILESNEQDDMFGYSLAAADLDGDGFDDLALGIPGETSGTVRCGAVGVLFGTATGLRSTDNYLVHQDTVGILDTCQSYDHFGWSLTHGDYDASGLVDLVVGVPFQDVGSASDAGALHVLYNWAGRFPGGQMLLHQDTPSILDAPEWWDMLGY